MQAPMISVIVPIYNAEQSLARCVDSLISICTESVEIILVDDGSTDASGEICRAYAREYPSAIRVIEKENGGVSTARNAGMDVARGRYLCFVDSDDYVSPDYFSVIRDTLSAGEWDLVRFSWVQDDGKTMRRRQAAPLEAASRTEALPHIIDDICSKELNGPVAKVYRRDIIERHGIRFPIGASVAEDRAFNISYSIHVNSYLISERVIYCVNTQNGQSLSRKQYADLDVQFQIVSKYLTDVFWDADIPEEEKEQYCRAINFGECRSIYREAKELHRNRIGWFKRQKTLWKRCGEINRKKMHYPNTRYCTLIILPVRLRMTLLIDAMMFYALKRG